VQLFWLINHFIDPNEGSDEKKKKRRLEEKNMDILQSFTLLIIGKFTT
jgi:hypothetical protein